MLASIPSQYILIGSTVVVVCMGIMMMLVRAKSAKRPANAKKIIIPPFAMSTGALMFIFPYFRVSWDHILMSVLIGVICSILLIKTSKFHIIGEDVYLKPSKAFFFVLLGLLTFRTIAKIYLGGTFHLGELGGLFWILAFSMILPWRLAMLWQFKKLQKKLQLV
ncbi:MAG: cytochrome c biogenesis protein CcdC [Kurthia sp.]|nr:cytochrome c biogenesis protein CcdC [Candidatus Kurthia equi]